MTDLETARTVVADLAAASSGVYPGLEWAVAVARGESGLPELWITTNEGAGYIPIGVFVPRSMPLAARFDPDFDQRWFGWFNPAETVLRAVRARGDAVSAIATTWTQDSPEVRSATNDVAIAVAPSGAPSDADSSTLTRSRSHRLETIAPGLYQALLRDDGAQGEEYARHVTQLVAFSGAEMSSPAQSVARAVVAARWPSAMEWAALRTEYETERLMAGSQRPGLMGVEEPHQLVAYKHEFAHCRRLEALLCWEHHGPADVVYAAILAGVPVPELV
ncbi:chemotaxis protein [Mycolicibacterium septicum]|uniref:chemotaxis protein n=1 Tax=Mycolicibacterium septicum TaxID=98668 RepID=UPI002362E588|nr:chemotaxis protein [Mycolicibacterium septicum]